ncbi:MAG: hypothetical protein DYG98_24400 [Haliscomenobacteraceae bacterium CHB4]|nr:hypothetical protein [Saprospiraceae bacterium]MCE7926200.1 hypothetical protein [Haliscomenobacteraceae bacterium CHB4]
MTQLNKLLIYKTLMHNDRFVHYDEESIVRTALINESWRSSSPEEKQLERKEFLMSCQKRKSVIDLKYYENMIIIYDMIIALIKKLEIKFDERANAGESLELPLLHMVAFFFIEQDFIDRSIVPLSHIPPNYFNNIYINYNEEYPDLNLKEFAEKYTEMFESWPEKSKYDIKKS